MAAEETSDIAELGRTYERIARSLRQTLALKAKLKHDREAATKTATSAPEPAPAGPLAKARRVRDVRAAVTRVIWNEAESADDATAIEESFEDLLLDEVLRGDVCAESLDDLMASYPPGTRPVDRGRRRLGDLPRSAGTGGRSGRRAGADELRVTPPKACKILAGSRWIDRAGA